VLVDGHTWALNLRVLAAQRQSGQCPSPAKPHSGRGLAKWTPGPHIAWELETRFATRPDWTGLDLVSHVHNSGRIGKRGDDSPLEVPPGPPPAKSDGNRENGKQGFRGLDGRSVFAAVSTAR
jgi:hypothetical protein